MVVLGLEEEVLWFEISMTDVMLVVAVLDRSSSDKQHRVAQHSYFPQPQRSCVSGVFEFFPGS